MIPNREHLTQAARILAENLGAQLLGDVIIDHNRDAYRIRFRLPDNAPKEYYVAFVPFDACYSAQSSVNAIGEAIETVIALATKSRLAAKS